MKYFSIDIETTGIGEDCQILEFGAIFEDTDLKLPYETIPKFRAKFSRNGYIKGQIQGILLNVNLLKEIQENPNDCYYPSDKRFGVNFAQFITECGIKRDINNDLVITAAGKNFAFDLNFLSKETKLLEYVKISHRVLDPAMLYVDWTKERPPGLKECKDKAGLSGDVLHTSLDDAWDVIQLLRKFY